MSSLDEYAADVVRRLPNPPRTISTLAILGHLYWTSAARWLVGFGLVLGLPVTIVFAFLAEGELWVRVLGLAIIIPTTFMLLAAPAIGGLRLARALAAGIQILGEIVTARWLGPGLRPPTIQAGSHGMTVGTSLYLARPGDRGLCVHGHQLELLGREHQPGRTRAYGDGRATDRGLPVPLAGVVVPLPRLEPALDVDQLALRQVQASG